MPIGELVAGVDLPDVPAPTRRERTPKARRHFTQLDQIDQLVAARDADPELGFMARLLALCSLPRTNPGNQLQYVRRNGPYTLGMSAGINNRLPYGTRPRLLLAWVCTEAVARNRANSSRRLALRVHAESGHLQHQRRQAHQTSESDAAAVWLHGRVDLPGRARRAIDCVSDR